MMDAPIAHCFLVQATSAMLAAEQVSRFLHATSLLKYDQILIHAHETLSLADSQCWPLLEQGLLANRRFAQRMLSHLQAEGVEQLEQLLDLSQGYLTKVLHTLAHMLDGFIGIDSVFYNLVEDSHALSEGLRHSIVANPHNYWLVQVRAGAAQTSILQSVNSPS